MSHAAVASTSGWVLTWQGKLFRPYYAACCGGHTLRGDVLFPDAAAPHAGVRCTSCREARWYRWTVDLTRAVEKALDEMSKSLPPGIDKPQFLFRQANFIEASINNVAEALRDGARSPIDHAVVDAAGPVPGEIAGSDDAPPHLRGQRRDVRSTEHVLPFLPAGGHSSRVPRRAALHRVSMSFR